MVGQSVILSSGLGHYTINSAIPCILLREGDHPLRRTIRHCQETLLGYIQVDSTGQHTPIYYKQEVLTMKDNYKVQCMDIYEDNTVDYSTRMKAYLDYLFVSYVQSEAEGYFHTARRLLNDSVAIATMLNRMDILSQSEWKDVIDCLCAM